MTLARHALTLLIVLLLFSCRGPSTRADDAPTDAAAQTATDVRADDDAAEAPTDAETDADDVAITEPLMPPRFLALGDSYTIGERVAVDQRWPVQLVALLRDAGVTVADPEIIARTGWTTDELDAAITAADPQGPFPMVSLLIGVNNQYRGRSVESFRPEFVALLQRAIAFADGHPDHVIVVSIPDWGATPFAEGRDRAQVAVEIDAYNAVCAEEAARLGARFVDITPHSREHGDDPDFIAPDGLHPSGLMYRFWAEQALPLARQIL